MSEFIEVISKEALADIDKLISKIQEGTVAVSKMNAEFKKFNKPSDASGGIKKTNQETKKLNALQKETIRLQKALQAQKAKNELQNSEENKSLQKLRRSYAQQNRDLRISGGLYNEIQGKVNKLTREYNNLAIKQELGNKLTTKQKLKLQQLTSQLGKYQSALKKVDANIGKYNRNVGNYASGWNGLSNSINQLTREAPAFANSLQTGFMALSNNIPILIDEIDVLRRKNIALAKEGRATKSVFGQVTSAFFSWQTALSVGVTLLTLYGDELIRAIAGTTGFAKAQRELNKAMNDAYATSQAAAQSTENLRKIVLDTTETEEARLQALDELKKELPKLTDVTLDQIDAQGGLNKENKLFIEQTDLYVKALQARANAEALSSLMAEKRSEIIKKQLGDVEFLEAYIAAGKNPFALLGLMFDPDNERFAGDVVGDIVDKRSKEIKNLTKVLEVLDEEQKKYLSDYLEAMRKIGSTTNGGSATTSSSSSDDTFLFADEFAPKDPEQTLAYWKSQISALKKAQQEVATTSKQFDILQEGIELAEEALKQLEIEFGLFDGASEDVDDIATSVEKLGSVFEKVFGKSNILLEQMGKLAKLVNMDITTLYKSFQVLSDENSTNADRAQAIAVATEEIFSGIGETILQNERIRLENQLQANRDYYDNLIQEAEGNEVQQNFLREERDRKEKEIRRKQAENDRRLSLFKIALDTATAIVKVFATTPFPAGIPLAAAVAAIGAAQAAVISSQPLPEFKDGVKNFKGGYAILGDGGKNEPIVDKFGNLKGISPNTDTVMHLDKGDSVYSSISDLPDSVLEKTMLYNLTASSKSLSSYGKNTQNGLDAYQFERAIINSLKKAKFINNNKNNIDLGQELKLLKYKGR